MKTVIKYNLVHNKLHLPAQVCHSKHRQLFLNDWTEKHLSVWSASSASSSLWSVLISGRRSITILALTLRWPQHRADDVSTFVWSCEAVKQPEMISRWHRSVNQTNLGLNLCLHVSLSHCLIFCHHFTFYGLLARVSLTLANSSIEYLS